MAIQAILHLMFHLALKHSQLLLYHVDEFFHTCASYAANFRRSVVKLCIRGEIHLVPYLQHALIVKRWLKLQLLEDL